MVIDPTDHFDIETSGERDVGEVGLPEFVRAVCSEPLPRRPRSFLGLRLDPSFGFQQSPDRRSRHHDPFTREQLADRVGARIVTICDQLVTMLERPCDDLVWGAVR